MSARRSVRFRLALAVVAATGLLVAFVYPTSAWWDQRQDRQEAERRLELLRSEADDLELERERLATDEVVERLARERFNLVRPGETAWAVVPGPRTPQEPNEPEEPEGPEDPSGPAP